MQKKYSITSIVSIVSIVSCSFTTVDQGQNGFENQEDISSEAALSQPKDEISGTLVIYSGRKESLVSEIISQFVLTSGVKVDVRYANSAELAGTLILEGANSPADIFFSQDPISLGKVAKEGFFDKLPPKILENVPNWAIDKNNYWVGTSGRSRSLVVDTRNVEDSELPNDIYGLADEKFRNRLGLAPTNSSFIAMVACMIELDGEEKVLDWHQINDLDMENIQNSPQVAAVVAGELILND